MTSWDDAIQYSCIVSKISDIHNLHNIHNKKLAQLLCLLATPTCHVGSIIINFHSSKFDTSNIANT